MFICYFLYDTIFNKEKQGGTMTKKRVETIDVVVIPKRSDNAKINRVIRYIEKNYMKELSLPEAAEVARVTPVYLSSLFREVMDMTFVEYCNAYRINRAAYLLLHENITVKEIAAKVGYGSDSYLIKLFSDAISITPSKYREQAIKENKSFNFT